MSRNQTEVGARLAELEATVRGLTQELVEANERIRQLEAAMEDGAASGSPGAPPSLDEEEGDGRTAGAGDDTGGRDGGSTRQMGDDRKAEEEAGSDLDDIIVA